MSEILTVDKGIDIAAEISQSYVDLTKVLANIPADHAHWRAWDDLPPELASISNLPIEKFNKEAGEFLFSQGIPAEVYGYFLHPVNVMTLVPFPKGVLWNPESTVRIFREIDFSAEIDRSDYENYPMSQIEHLLKFEVGANRVEGNIYKPYVIGLPARGHPRTNVLLLTRGEGYKERVREEITRWKLPAYEELVVRRPGSELLIAFRDAAVPSAV